MDDSEACRARAMCASIQQLDTWRGSANHPSAHMSAVHGDAATFVKAKWTADGRPEFEAADFKEMEARARGPDVLTPQEEAMALEAKAAGNEQFRAGSITEALEAYNRALGIYADRRGDPDQMFEKSILFANRAECLLRLEKWEAALKAADNALSLDAMNSKARFRHARALEALGGETNLSAALADLEELRLGSSDGLLCRSEAELHKKVVAQQAELRNVRHRDAAGLRKAFAAGNTGLRTESELAADTVPVDLETATKDSPPPSAASEWCARLGEVEAITRYAWVIDCYRTRVEDDSKRGDQAHGLRATQYSAGSVVLDFLIFCRLAVTHGVLTPGQWAWWQWEGFLAEAAKMVVKVFEPEKCRAELRYGEEMGRGKCFRDVARLIYDSDAAGTELAKSYEHVRREMVASCWQDGGLDENGRHQHKFTFDRHPEAFAPLGGVHVWRTMLARVGQSPPFGAAQK